MRSKASEDEQQMEREPASAVYILLFVPTVLIAYRWLMPGLSMAGKRLASLMLAAQIFVIGMALLNQPSTSFETWLWHLDREWNIPSTLAALQLSLVGFAALLRAILTRSSSAWHSLYFAGVGLVFLFLSYDEYAMGHESIIGWQENYMALGAVLALLTLALAARSPRRGWRWHAAFLAGLGLSAVGALVVEAPSKYNISFIAYGPYRHWLEESLEFLGVWLALVAILGHLSALAPLPRFWRRAYTALSLLWLLLLALGGVIIPISAYAGRSTPADVAYDTDVRLLGYRLEDNQRHLHLFMSAGRWDFFGRGLSGLGYSVQLLDQVDGGSVLGRDAYSHQRFFLLAPGYAPVYRQWIDLGQLERLPANRAYWLVLTLWRDDNEGYARLGILGSDLDLLSEDQAILGEVLVPADTPEASPAGAPLARFENGFALDAVEMPPLARAGEALPIHFFWRSDVDADEDHAQFLHLGHAESGEWWVYDQQPLGPRLPTRLWYSGLADSELWQAPLPADLAPGRYNIFTGLYRARDRERVTATGAEGGAFLDARVPLGSLLIE